MELNGESETQTTEGGTNCHMQEKVKMSKVKFSSAKEKS